MANDFFNASGYPSTRSPGVSSSLRNELANIALAFDKFPGLTGNAGKVLGVNPSGTALAYLTAIENVTVGVATPAAGKFTTLQSTGAATLASLSVTGAATLGSIGTLTVTGNGTVAGTFGVTGATTLGAATMASLSVSGTLGAGASTLASLGVTGAATVGTTLGVTGATTVGGTLDVTGTLTGSLAVMNFGSGVGLTLNRTGNTVNSVAGFQTTSGTVYAGQGSANTFAVGSTSNLALATNQWLAVTSSAVSSLSTFNAPITDSQTLPGYSWTTDTDTGIWHAANDAIGFAVGGISTWHVLSTGSFATHAAPPTFTTTGKISVAGTGSTFGSSIVVSRFDDASTSVAPALRFGRSRGTVVGDYTTLVNGDSLGELTWYGANGTLGTLSARIRATTTEAYTASASGAQIEFGTITTGTNTFATRMILESGLTTIQQKVYVLDGTATGQVANSNADSLVIDATGNTGLTFLGSTTAIQQILFGDTDSNARGVISYNHGTDTMALGAAGTVVSLDSGGMTLAASKELVLADVTPTTGFSAGFRSIPTIGGVSTAAKAGVGKCYFVSAAFAVNNSVFAAGDVIAVYNNSAAAITINGTITTMRLGGTATTGPRTLAPRGFASIFFVGATECVVTGAGVS